MKKPYTVNWEHDGNMKSVQLLLGEVAEIDKHLDDIKLETKKTPAKKCKGCGKARGLKDLIIGSAKLLKSELGIDASDEKTVANRKKLCESCKHYDFGVCDQCGCFCSAKVRLKSEKCPVGKW